MVAFEVFGAAIVDLLSVAAFGLLRFGFAGDRTAAMTTFDQFAGVGHLVRPVEPLTEKFLDSIPCRPVHKWLLGARIPLPLVADLSNVGSVGQQGVQFATVKFRP